MSERNQDANHPATPARLSQAQRDGDVAKSQEMAVAIQLLCGIASVWLLMRLLISGVVDFSTETWAQRSAWQSGSAAEVQSQIAEAVSRMTLLLLPLLGVIFVGAVVSHVFQSGAAAAFKKPLFQIQHLHPAHGAQRLLSVKNIARGFVGIPKVFSVIAVSLTVTWYRRVELVQLQWNSIDEIVSRINNCLFAILISGAATLLVLSVLDYVIERFSYLKRLQMTDQELRDENAMQGPSPQITGRRQQFYRNL